MAIDMREFPMVANTLPPPDGLVGRVYPGHQYRRPPPPAPPPPKGGFHDVPWPPVPPRLGEKTEIIPPAPVKRLELTLPPPWERKKMIVNREKEKPPTLLAWLGLIVGIVTFSWLMALGMEKQQKDVSDWAKSFDYRHCWGKFDTPACHERKAKENAEAYKNYKD